MLRNFRLLPAMTALVYSLILVGAGVAFAKGSHKHQAGLQLLGSKINTDGKHELHKVAGHTVHAQVSNKKIANVTVTGPKGDVAVKKYKSSKKMAAVGGSAHEYIVKVSTNEIAQLATDYIGYAFTDPVTLDTYIYWFPADVVVDPSGAVVYVTPV
jgi:hypothetical protein